MNARGDKARVHARGDKARVHARRTAYLLAGAWLAAGIGLKLARYGEATPSWESRSEVAVIALMSSRGWHVTARPALVAGNLAYALEFRRSGCPGRTDVAILASGPDLAPLAAEEFPGMVFLSNHELHSEPPRDALHIVRPNLPGNVSLPLVAIAPAPTAQPDECDRPPVADWQALTLNGGGLPLSP